MSYIYIYRAGNAPAIVMVSRFVDEVKRANGYPPNKWVPGTRPRFEGVFLVGCLSAYLVVPIPPCQHLTCR